MTERFSCEKLAEQILFDCKKRIEEIRNEQDISPCVVTIMVGEDPASRLYLRLRGRATEKAGIFSKVLEFPASISQDDLVHKIEMLNQDADVQGILVQYPLPDGLSDELIMTTVAPEKDVEGFHPLNMGKTLLGKEDLVPCTPLAVLRILKWRGIDVKGKHCVVVNHSNVVGRPLSVLLLKRNATVSVCHEYTVGLAEITNLADVLIPATGIGGLINADHVKKDATVIDVGISTDASGGVRGDVNSDGVEGIAESLSVVPGGVGPVTIACAVENMVRCIEKCI